MTRGWVRASLISLPGFATLVVLLAWMLSGSAAHAQDAHEACEESRCWPVGSAMEVGHRHAQRRDAADRQLTVRFAELLERLEEIAGPAHGQGRLFDALRAQQQAWLAYRSSECELIGALTGALSAWQSAHAIKCEANHAEWRLRRTRHATRCIRRLQDAGLDRIDHQINSCLQQLAPLTNRL